MINLFLRPRHTLAALLCAAALLSASPAFAEPSPANFTEPVTGMEFVLVEGGRFLMGDLYGSDSYARPAHPVSVRDFYLGKFEVTFAEFDAFCAATGRPKPEDEGWGRGRRPVINVSWADAVAFTEWLSGRGEGTFRLPSEAEWEYAARAGTTGPYWWGNRVGSNNANCAGCGSRWDRTMTAPVGSFTPNPWGLHDMLGNVYEWVLDEWHENYRQAPDTAVPWRNGSGPERISRGGAYSEVPGSLKVHARNWTDPGPHRDTGFRVLLVK